MDKVELEINAENMKDVLKKQMPQNGWTITKEQDDIWETQIEFEKGNYWIQISNGNFGESNYGTSYKDSTIAY